MLSLSLGLGINRSSGLRVPRPTFYVGAGGNDGNDGMTWATRWLTLAKVAATTFNPGNLILLDGTFNETLTLVPSKHNHITLGIVGEGATIHGQDTRNYCLDARGCDLLSINDLVLQDPVLTGLLFTSGRHVVNRVVSDGSGDQAFQGGGGLAPSNITFNECVASNAVDDGYSHHPQNGIASVLRINGGTISGCFEGYQDAGVFACQAIFNGTTFNANTHDVSNSLASEVNLQRCLLKGMSGGGHQSINAANLTADYCIFDMADSGFRTEVAAVQTGGIVNLNNCTFYGLNGVNVSGGLIAGDGATLNATNCIFDRIWRVINGGTGVSNLDHCESYDVTILTPTTNTNAITGNPLLTNPASNDFSLGTGSPAIHTGTSYAGQLTTDFSGNPVHATTPSLGAVEYI